MNPTPDVLIAYRNLKVADPRISHVGLGVNALHTCKCLRAAGIACDVAGVRDAAHLEKELSARPATTHVVIEAPWLSDADVLSFCNRHSRVEVTCRTHSQVGFLQVEAGAVRLIREYLRLQDHTPNFRNGANSPRLAAFLDHAYYTRTLVLPNLYLPHHGGHRCWRAPTDAIRVGSFGATRLMKGHMTAAAAALTLASLHRIRLEFSLSVNRQEHGLGVLDAIRSLFADVSYARLIEVPWQPWGDFRKTVAGIDLHIQLSMSETHNLVTADAAGAGIPTVSSSAIDWVPDSWKVDIDDAYEAARVGWRLVNDPHAGQDGRDAMDRYHRDALHRWKSWLGVAA